MDSVHVGIDPGVNGAIAVLADHGDRTQVLATHSMPVMRNDRGKKVLDARALAQVLRGLVGLAVPASVFMENVQPVPGKIGASGAFQYGKTVGATMGIIYGFGWPLTLITPYAWKRKAGLLKEEKDASRRLAQKLYPMVNLRLKKDTDRAEAILIAHFGLRIERDNA